MTDHAYNEEARHLREKRILAAQAMRAKGMKTALIAQAIGVGVATTQKYLVQTTIDEECKPKMPVPQKKRAWGNQPGHCSGHGKRMASRVQRDWLIC